MFWRSSDLIWLWPYISQNVVFCLFFLNIFCACNYYLKHLQISSWDCKVSCVKHFTAKSHFTYIDEATTSVKSFYNSDEVSRIMPGKKKKITYQLKSVVSKYMNRNYCCAIWKSYTLILKIYIQESVGFLKFASLHPRYCIMAGASGTHSVRVCTVHQNVKLMLEICKVSELRRSMSITFFLWLQWMSRTYWFRKYVRMCIH
jgi:hypothetical protein